MSLSRVHTWSNGEVLTHTDLNAEFDNILNNALSLISPLTGNLNANGNDITGVDELVLASNASSPVTAGALRTHGAALEYHDGGAARVVALHGVTNLNFVSATASTDYTNNTNAYTDVTGYSVTITTAGGS